MINTSGIPTESISISIKETQKNGMRIAALNASQYRVPASIAKAATTYAALLELGENYRWSTKIYRDGDISNGTLNGNLIIKGFGDPSLDSKSVSQIVSYIKAKGISKISGNIIIDKSYFDTCDDCSAKFDENPSSPYNAMPSALMFNENTTTIKIVKGNEIIQNIQDDSYDIINEIIPSDEPCRGRYSWPSVRIKYGDRAKVTLGGTISRSCPSISLTHLITKSHLSFYGALKEQLNSNGVNFTGSLKVKKTPNLVKEIATIYSDTIFPILGETNKKSNNLYARQIFLTIGAKRYEAPATLEKSRKALVSIFEKNGIRHATSFKLDNGSGLSRIAKVTTEGFESMLDHAYDKYQQRWLNALSIAGVDGTIKRRFPQSLSRRVWMKTGTVNGVKNIVGYVKANDGTMYTVAIIVNHRLSASRGATLENQIIIWLANGNASQFATEDTKRKEEIEVRVEETQQLRKLENYESKEQPEIFKQTSEYSNRTENLFIQVGIFDKSINRELERKIKSHGFGYKTINSELGHKVLVGPFDSKKDAINSLQKIREDIAPDAFLVQPK
jgi:D-alanyl-D-alanine carboxypeptidase/D-alanyl-D-alanine-endopeptidase (penicillin-binding protein 4)